MCADDVPTAMCVWNSRPWQKEAWARHRSATCIYVLFLTWNRRETKIPKLVVLCFDTEGEVPEYRKPSKSNRCARGSFRRLARVA